MSSLIPSKSLIVAAAGTASALIMGYCIYYDHKRRSDPNYKRNVHERRENQQEQNNPGMTGGKGGSRPAGVPDFNDHDALERYFLNEIKIGEQLISQGHMDEGLTHLANAIVLCAEPEALMQMLQGALPEQIFLPLMQKLNELQLRSDESEPNEATNSADNNSLNSYSSSPTF